MARRTPAFRQINEMGEVPVLEHQDRRLAQSGVILDYLVGRFGQFGWTDEDERREVLLIREHAAFIREHAAWPSDC